MDAIDNPVLNITPPMEGTQATSESKTPTKNNSNNIRDKDQQNPVVALQLVQFVSWETTPYGRKEMQTSFPGLLTINENSSLFDLRSVIAARVGIPFQNLNLATSSSFPILDGYITPIKEHTKTHADSKVLDPFLVKEKEREKEREKDREREKDKEKDKKEKKKDKEKEREKLEKEKKEKEKEKQKELEKSQKEDDPDEQATKMAELENREKKTFSFKAEKTVTVKKLRLRMLDIICYEDMRIKVDKPANSNAVRVDKSKRNNRDAESLKIKN